MREAWRRFQREPRGESGGVGDGGGWRRRMHKTGKYTALPCECVCLTFGTSYLGFHIACWLQGAEVEPCCVSNSCCFVIFIWTLHYGKRLSDPLILSLKLRRSVFEKPAFMIIIIWWQLQTKICNYVFIFTCFNTCLFIPSYAYGHVTSASTLCTTLCTLLHAS